MDSFFKHLNEEIANIAAKDPAAHSRWEVLFCYPGLHAVLVHRASHWLWGHGMRLPARILSYCASILTGIEIHPAATIGRRVFIDHGTGVVIGETAEVGDDVTLYHGVTLGGTSLDVGKRHPTLEHGVVVGSGAQVLGPIVVGAGARIGSNAVVLKDVPPGATMVGIPAKVARRQKPEVCEEDFRAYGVEPMASDPIGQDLSGVHREMEALYRRLEVLEARVGGTDMPSDAGQDAGKVQTASVKKKTAKKPSGKKMESTSKETSR